MSDAPKLLDTLRRDGCIHDPYATLASLSGGVSSDVYLVRDGAERFVVKRALAKLRVKDDWFADVGRNATEQDYIRCVSRFLPEAVPQLRFSNLQSGCFGMEYLGEGFANWKRLLLDGCCEPAHAANAGLILGTIHQKTAGDPEIASRFDTTATFHQLRTDAYLLTTGMRHPRLATLFFQEAERLETTRECLVHGDFSPKNILIGESRTVVLDCETAWYGDPAFDAAFVLNHFFLKSLFHAPRRLALAELISTFWRAYSESRETGAARRVEQRLVPLLMMLMLARVDGKSPAEYLSAPKQQFIRDFVHTHLPTPPTGLDTLTEKWFEEAFRRNAIGPKT